MESFSDKLKSLGFKTAVNLPSGNVKKKKSLEERIGGKVICNSLGEFVLKMDEYPLGYRHGKIEFSSEVGFSKLRDLGKVNRTNVTLDQLVFLDTETSGLSGGTGTFAFLVGIGRFEKNCFRLQQLIIRDPLEEAAMLLHLGNEIRNSDVFVTYNGKSFDLPILVNRYRLNRQPVSFQENDHLDLLHLSRKIWKNQLPSCGLKDLERDVLGFLRSEDDIPGWMIPDIYFEYLRTNDPERISNVIYHNAIDIVSLAALFLHSSQLINANKDLPGISAGDLRALGKAFADIGKIDEAIDIYTKYRELFQTSNDMREIDQALGNLYKKKGEIDLGLLYWIKASESGCVDTCIELAMYYEHSKKDYPQALFWANYALSNQKRNKIADIDSIRHRINRINRKAGGNV